MEVTPRGSAQLRTGRDQVGTSDVGENHQGKTMNGKEIFDLFGPELAARAIGEAGKMTVDDALATVDTLPPVWQGGDTVLDELKYQAVRLVIRTLAAEVRRLRAV